jgi:hypothetical protein
MFRSCPSAGHLLVAVVSRFALDSKNHRMATLGCDRPMTYCMPHGVPDAMTVAGLPFKILQMPDVTVLLFEEFHNYRQIHTKVAVDPNPAWKRSVVLGMATRLVGGKATPSPSRPRASRKALLSTWLSTSHADSCRENPSVPQPVPGGRGLTALMTSRQVLEHVVGH